MPVILYFNVGRQPFADMRKRRERLPDLHNKLIQLTNQ